LGVMNETLLQPPSLQRRLSIVGGWIAVSIVVVGGSELWLFPWIKAYLSHPDLQEARDRLWNVSIGLSTLGLSVAGWVLWMGIRVLRCRQWPLPGAVVFKPTRVAVGRMVVLRGVALVACGIGMSAAALYFLLSMHAMDITR
jgi:hypothetical protein